MRRIGKKIAPKVHRLGSAIELASEVKAFRDGRTLGSYTYSSREMIIRFMKQNRTTVGTGGLAGLNFAGY